MYEQYSDRASFLTVYIRESHPTDEWQMDANEKENVCYRQPRSLGERVLIANDFAKRFRYTLPLLVDPIDNRAEKLYAAWPERFYIIDTKGTIVYKGKPGPSGFKPNEVENWLKAHPPAQAREVIARTYIRGRLRERPREPKLRPQFTRKVAFNKPQPVPATYEPQSE